MSHVQVVSIFFFIFSILLFFLFLFLGRDKKETILPKHFLLLSWGVYISGTLLIMVLSFWKSEIGLPLIVICEILVLFIAGGSIGLMHSLSRGLKAAAQNSSENKQETEQKAQDEKEL